MKGEERKNEVDSMMESKNDVVGCRGYEYRRRI